MMFLNKLVASIKADGKILREFKDTVYLNFGSEYSILLKNLDSRRAVVNVYIDGDNAVPGGLVIDPKQTVDLERWIKNGNLSEGNRFKFIERTGAIENGPRGIKLEDGLIRVEFKYELSPPRPVYNSPFRTMFGPSDYSRRYEVNGKLKSADFSKGAGLQASASAAIADYCASNNIKATSISGVHDGSVTMDWMENEVGITVPGSKSEQKFQTAEVGLLEDVNNVIVLRLVGDLGGNKPVEKPVTVKHKPKCVTCGHTNKATAKFCSECGTALTIYA